MSKSVNFLYEMKKAVKKVRPELHIFSFGGRSLTARIVEQTTQRGIFKLKYAMRELGLDESKILAVYGPGMAITNTEREREAGFEDGLKLFMEDCLWPYLGPVCRYGMFYVGDAINLSQIKKRYKNLVKEGLVINSKRFPPGTDHGNHFLEIRELRNAKNEFGPGYYAFDHFMGDCLWPYPGPICYVGSEINPSQLEKSNKNNEFEPGYYAFIHTSFEDAGKRVFEYMKTLNVCEIKTPLGQVEILDRENAEKFVAKCDQMENLAKKKIALIAEYLFKSPQEIMNASHKGYFRQDNFFGVKAGSFNSREVNLSFVSFSSYLPIYLIKGKTNVRKELWQRDHQKVKELGLESLLEKANIMPHGGAETTDNLLCPACRVEYSLEENRLCLRRPNGLKILGDPRAFNTRFKTPEEVIPYIKKYGLGEVVATFQPLYKL